MKIVGFFMIGFFSLNLLANIPNLCPWKGYCSTAQESILDGFNFPEQLAAEPLSRVYSGTCYYNGSGFNNETPQRALLLIDQKDGELYLFGQFGFFKPDDYYSNVDIIEALKLLNPVYEKKHRLTLFDDGYAFADFNPSGEPPVWQDYLTENNGDLLLLGLWSIHNQVFCRLSLN